MECNETIFFVTGEGLSLKSILQHFAVETSQTKDDLTLLLTLLKTHKPEPCYDSLPYTGKGLLPVSGSDIPKYEIPK
jgi:hypothetical protein